MPYISKEDREHLLPDAENPEGPGGLNYQLTCIIKQYLDRNGLSYRTINDIVGALEGAKMEFVRQVVNPYEDTKIQQNGGLY